MTSPNSQTEGSPDNCSGTEQDEQPLLPCIEAAHNYVETTERDPEPSRHELGREALILHLQKVEKEKQELQEDLNEVLELSDDAEERYDLLESQNAEYYADLQKAKEEIQVLKEEVRYIKQENVELVEHNNQLQKNGDDHICMMCGVKEDSWVKADQGVQVQRLLGVRNA
ncbi:hypothetical protein BZA77DRAFT_355761 [Pyronema omphalodes]|nr:hypothetical protein BZA77DRAFT_355761 [Pyronema omphalodes]